MAAICVYPEWIERVIGTGVPVAAVANFPAGEDDPDLAAREAGGAVQSGATEVDVVVPWRAFAAGDTSAIERTVAAARAAVGAGVGLKAILETGSLGGPELVRDAGRQRPGRRRRLPEDVVGQGRPGRVARRRPRAARGRARRGPRGGQGLGRDPHDR